MDQTSPNTGRGRSQVLGSIGVDGKRRGFVLLGTVYVIEGGGVEDPLGLDAADRLVDGRGIGDVERAMVEGMQFFTGEDVDQVVPELTVRSGDQDAQLGVG